MTKEIQNACPVSADALKEIERFIVENDDLLELESRVGKFNIFDALGITRVEIRHSNFLAFILDPAESHGLGQLFLKAILMDLLARSLPSLRPLSPIDLDGADLRGVEVKREWKNIDLLITCNEPRFAVVIENKVGSQEHSDQLNRYRRTMENDYPKFSVLHVFLTPDGDEPSDQTWVAYTYGDIHRVLSRVRDTYESAIGIEVRTFLDHYLSLLGARFMNDDKLDELCRRIYKNHRQALDLIWERVGRPQSAGLLAVIEVLQDDDRWHILYSSGSYVDFVPKKWLEWLPKFDPAVSYPVCINIRSRESDLGYTVFIGPMANDQKRGEIISELREKAANAGFRRSKASSTFGKWNRVTAVDTFVEWSDDSELEADGLSFSANVKTKLNELFPKLDGIGSELKTLMQ